jgi:hypothetical protein
MGRARDHVRHGLHARRLALINRQADPARNNGGLKIRLAHGLWHRPRLDRQ